VEVEDIGRVKTGLEALTWDMLLQHPEKMPLSLDVGKRGHRGKFMDVVEEQ